MNELRRSFLKLTGGATALAVVTMAGLLKTGQALAAWNKAGFESKAVADVLKSLGATDAAESKDIVITAPDIAENGAVVPIAVTSRIPNTQQISVVAEKNPFPLAATFDVGGGGEGYVSTRIKMGQTSNVWAVVKAGGKYYVAKKEVKITVGGCG
ncbi:MAG: thiosulfate oxidation carrier protein SoxY [Betaproteobacteria bacterium]|nr:thiosulfate oxidation carrier protein SoxY [Betaproteobacteria bacterium]